MHNYLPLPLFKSIFRWLSMGFPVLLYVSRLSASIQSKQVGVSSIGKITATSYVRAEQQTLIQFCYDSRMTLSKVKQDEYHLNVSQALVCNFFSRFREEKPADERMGKPPLRNTGDGSRISRQQRQKTKGALPS